MINLTQDCKLTRVIDQTAAGTSAVNGTIIDMKEFGSCTFIVGFGAIVSGAATSIKVQQDSDSAMGAAADLLGTSITVADDDDTSIAAVEVVEPLERYIRVVVSRATQNAEVDFGLAIQANPKVSPVTHDATTVISTELHASPAEGTA